MNAPHSLRSILQLAGVSVAAALLPAALGAADEHAAHAMPAPAVTAAAAVLLPTQGNEVRGTVRFTKVTDGVRVVADVAGLKPGKHGFHVHEFGDATSADGSAAGGHFNPGHQSHGAPNAAQRHAGDLGNLEADASGHAALDYVDPVLALDGPNSIVGRGLIVHADADDLVSQPTGNAGKRVACGVIGLAKGS
jgi:Cu-Zn family superoxide dismutase